MLLFIKNDFGTITLGFNIETFLLAFISLVLIFLIFWGLFHKSARDKYEKQRSEEELEAPYEEPPLEEVDVTIIKLRCGTKLQGSKTPIAVKEFYAIFKTESGEEFELSLDEQSYFSLEEGKKGTLALVNGNFYGFCEEE